MYELDYYSPDDLDVRVADMLVATADAADKDVHPKVPEVLGLLRERLGMDVVFVSEFVGDRRVFRFVDRASGAPPVEPGQSDPLEESWCQRVVDGRMPGFVKDAGPLQAAGQLPDVGIEVGTYISTPIQSKEGQVYGTLCCFSRQVSEHATEKDLQRLRYCANLLVTHLDPTHQWPDLPSR